MGFGLQIASLAVVLTINVNFFQNKRMPLLSTKLFAAFIILAACNICFEFSTLYTIYHIEEVVPWVNRLCHQLFIGSLNLVMFFVFLYVDMKGRGQKRYSIMQYAVRFIPIIVAVVTIIFGNLNYHISPDGRYSYGSMAVTVYLSLAVYVILIFTILLRKRIKFDRTERQNILLGIIIWAVIVVIQLAHPTALLSSMGVSLMTLFVYISKENPREYTDFELLNTLNRKAYEIVQQEWFESRKDFFVISFAITNGALLRNSYGNSSFLQIQQAMADHLGQMLKSNVYNTGRNTLGMLTPKDEITEALYERLKEICRQGNDMAHLQISVLHCPTFGKNKEEAEDILSFVNGSGRTGTGTGIIRINESIVDKFDYRSAVDRILQKAINEDGLEVYYQPIYNTKKQRFVSAEALVRLKDKETVGFVSPELFIPIAEERNLIGELGRMVFDKVCRFYSENRLQEKGIEYIEVNLSGKQIVDGALPESLLKCVKRYGIKPENINLEITETAAVAAREHVMSNMKALKEAGFTFSMDDFGTGYSNLSEMADTDFNLIKLDKSLIWPCFEEYKERPRVILSACIDMIQNLGKEIVAEGVETEAQVKLLTEKKVTYLQGYYFSRPLPQKDYLEFIQEKMLK